MPLPRAPALGSRAAVASGSGEGTAVDLADGDAALVLSKRDSVAAASLGCPDQDWRVVLVSASTLACCWESGKRRREPHAASNQQCVSGTAEQTRLGQGIAEPPEERACAASAVHLARCQAPA